MATEKTIVLITGANTGLGLETVKALCQSSRPYLILLGGRSPEKANQAVTTVQEQFPDTPSTVEAVQIDIEDDSSISKLFEAVEKKYGRVDTLLNNAGTQLDPLFAQGKITMRELWDRSWSVNVTSTQIMTNTFVPLLLKSSDPRLIFITSGTSTLAEQANQSNKGVDLPPPAGWPKQSKGFAIPAYRSSKTGMNMMMREWARMLEEDGVKVWCISPGMLATGLGGQHETLKAVGALDPSVGAHFIKDVVEGKRDADVGKVIRKDNVQPW